MTRHGRVAAFAVMFSFLGFGATCWSTAPKGPDASVNSDAYCAAFKVGIEPAASPGRVGSVRPSLPDQDCG